MKLILKTDNFVTMAYVASVPLIRLLVAAAYGLGLNVDSNLT